MRVMRQKVYIGVMGVTGAGKSTFIKAATQDDSIGIGEDMKSCTIDVQKYSFVHEDVEVVLIDTPGFNDTTRGETEVLKEIADWLDLTYRNGNIKLSGVIYMQAIDDRRMYGSTLRNLRMFTDLCGEKPLKNVIFTTTGWGLARKSDRLSQAIEKEGQLCVDTLFWEPMLRRGATTARFEDTRKSALDIIMRLVSREPLVLQIQTELVDESMQLVDTKAGNTVNEEAKRLEAKYRAEIDDLKSDMERALKERDHDLQEALEEHKQKLEKLRDEARRSQDLLNYQRRNADRQHEIELSDLRVAFEEHKMTSQEELKKARAEAAAQRYEEELHFEGIAQRMRENFDRVRLEERVLMESKIQELEQEQKKEKKRGRGKKLLLNILPIVGNLALSAVGLALGAGPLAGLF